MQTITISSKNQIVIPSSVRAKMGVQSGDKLVVARMSDQEVVLQKEPTYRGLIGTLPVQKHSPVKRIRELRANWK